MTLFTPNSEICGSVYIMEMTVAGPWEMRFPCFPLKSPVSKPSAMEARLFGLNSEIQRKANNNNPRKKKSEKAQAVPLWVVVRSC